MREGWSLILDQRILSNVKNIINFSIDDDLLDLIDRMLIMNP